MTNLELESFAKKNFVRIMVLGCPLVVLAIVFWPNPTRDKERAISLVKQIRSDMSFQKIAEIIPLDKGHPVVLRDSGITFYVPLNGGLHIVLVFEPPLAWEEYENLRINRSPILMSGTNKIYDLCEEWILQNMNPPFDIGVNSIMGPEYGEDKSVGSKNSADQLKGRKPIRKDFD